MNYCERSKIDRYFFARPAGTEISIGEGSTLIAYPSSPEKWISINYAVSARLPEQQTERNSASSACEQRLKARMIKFYRSQSRADHRTKNSSTLTMSAARCG